MKKTIMLSLLALLLAACSGTRKEQHRGTEEMSLKAPDFTLTTIDGKAFTLSSLHGKYVVLDFWGAWCPWCIKGFPELKRYYEKYKDRMEVVGIDCNDTDQAWRKAVADNALPWLQVKNGEGSNDVTALYGINGFPTKYIISPEGEMLTMAVGEDPAFYEKLDRIMAADTKNK